MKSNTTGATCGAAKFAPFFTCLSGARVVHVVKLHVFSFLVPCCDACYVFCVQKDVELSFVL